MNKLVFNPRLVEAKILGIIIKIIKGFFAPPGNFTGRVLRNAAAFTWEPVLAASGYRIYRDNEFLY